MTQQFSLPPLPQFAPQARIPQPEKLPAMPPLGREEWDAVYEKLPEQWAALDQKAGDDLEAFIWDDLMRAAGIEGVRPYDYLQSLGPPIVVDLLTGQQTLGPVWAELFAIDAHRTIRLIRQLRDLTRREERKASPEGAIVAATNQP